MWQQTLSPIIFQLGKIQITFYALVYILGFLLSLYILLKNSEEINLKKEKIYDLIIFQIIGVLFGARIFHILFWDLSHFIQNPERIFFIWQGGLSFHGGLLGLSIATILFAKKEKINPLKIADILVIPLTLILAFGRIANYLNNEIIGISTKLNFCVKFPNTKNCRHPVQLYAAGGRFILFIILVTIKNNLKKFKQGFLFWSFLFLISIGRFFLDFLRQDARFIYLSAGQWLSLLTLTISITALTKYKQDIKRIFKKD